MSESETPAPRLPPFPYVIVGLGLLGGSLAKAVRSRLKEHGGRVIGVDPDATTRAMAEASGAVDLTLAEITPEVAAARHIVIATPLAALEAVLPALAAAADSGAIVSDVIGVKMPVLAAVKAVLPRARYVSVHPMAGGEHGGFAKSRADLFDARTVVVCPNERDPDATSAVSALWRELGGQVVAISPSEHDRVVAATSHLPYLAALALVRVATREQGDMHIAGRGFADATRRADFDPEVMAAVVGHNPFAPRALHTLAGQILRLAEIVETSPEALVREAREVRDAHRALHEPPARD